MAMIDWEDKAPAPPMGAGEKLFLGLVVVMTGYGYFGMAQTLYNTVAGWLS